METAAISTPTIAYVAEGKLYLKREASQPQLIESPFVQGLLDRVARTREKNDWKSSGMAWQFSSRQMSPNAAGPSAETRRVRFSGVSRGGAEGELLYALDTDHVGGLFSLDTKEHYERESSTATVSSPPIFPDILATACSPCRCAHPMARPASR